MENKILGLLGLMRKASALAIGEDNAEDAVRSGRAKLILLPSDAPDKRIEKTERMLSGKKTLSAVLPYENTELADALGIGSCSILAVTDLGFAESLLKSLSSLSPELQQTYEELKRRREKADRRKKDTLLNGKKKQRKGE